VRYGLFVPFPTGIWLGGNIKLGKYGFKDGSELELKVRSQGGFKQATEEGEQLQFLKVQIPEENVTRTLSFNKDTAFVKDVLQKVIKKFFVPHPSEWAVLNNETTEWLDPEAPLSDYNLKHMQVLLFQKIPVNSVFGIEPSRLPEEERHGFAVPSVLWAMIDALHSIRGFEREKLLSLQGDKQRTALLRNRISMRLPLNVLHPNDAYSIAELIQQYFAELPRKLMKGINVAFYSINEETSLRMEEALQPDQKSLWQFLLWMLVELQRHRHENVMTIHDISFQCASVIADISVTAPPAERTTSLEQCAIILYFNLAATCATELEDPESAAVEVPVFNFDGSK